MNNTTNQDSGGSIPLTVVTERNEHAFTIRLPDSWQNQAYLVRPGGMTRTACNSRSPDGTVYFFLGNPELPLFMEPTPDLFPGFPMINTNPLVQHQTFVPADPFFARHIRERFGRMPGFRITAAAPCPPLERLLQEQAQKRGIPTRITTVSFSFDFMDNGKPMRARFHGATCSMGPGWFADVNGIITTADHDPACYDDILFQCLSSFTTNPQWQLQEDQMRAQQQAQQQWQQQQFQNQMQQNHASNMAWIQNSAQQHQIRMDAIHAAGDASMNAWQAQQASSDAMHRNFMNGINEQNTVGYGNGYGAETDFTHRRFLNYVTEQNTVVGQDGSTYQVEDGYDRYYKHKDNDTYFGTDNTVEQADLRARFGVNPDDYEEVNVRR